MSLSRTMLRLATVGALTNNWTNGQWPTLAGPHVYDNHHDPLIPITGSQRIPCINIYTRDDSTVLLGGQSSAQAGRTLVLEIEIAIRNHLAVENPDDTQGHQWFAAETDAGLEIMLDLLEQQVRTALKHPLNRWAECWQSLIIRDLGYTSAPKQDSQGNYRLAARTLKYDLLLAEDCQRIPLNQEHLDEGCRVVHDFIDAISERMAATPNCYNLREVWSAAGLLPNDNNNNGDDGSNNNNGNGSSNGNEGGRGGGRRRGVRRRRGVDRGLGRGRGRGGNDGQANADQNVDIGQTEPQNSPQNPDSVVIENPANVFAQFGYTSPSLWSLLADMVRDVLESQGDVPLPLATAIQQIVMGASSSLSLSPLAENWSIFFDTDAAIDAVGNNHTDLSIGPNFGPSTHEFSSE